MEEQYKFKKVDNWIFVHDPEDQFSYSTMERFFGYTRLFIAKALGIQSSIVRTNTLLYNTTKEQPYPLFMPRRENIPATLLDVCSYPVSNAIRTTIPALDLLANYIFQMSHELTHLIIDTCKLDYVSSWEERHVSWFEETICEAMSLFVLHQAYKHWSSSPFYQETPDYDRSLQKYLEKEVSTKAGWALKQCTTISDLVIVSQNASNKRGDRIEERNRLYSLFLNNPRMIKSIKNYPRHVCSDGVLINFEQWLFTEPHHRDFLMELATIQPKVVPT